LTHYGINPSFANGRLPLFSNPLKRAREFQVFTDQGAPTPERSPLNERGLPVEDGRSHGLRVFESMGGEMPPIDALAWRTKYPWLLLRAVPGEALFVWSKAWLSFPELRLPESAGRWHVPSMQALAYTSPKVLRTLDWQRTNERPDWSRDNTPSGAPLQGDVMSVDLQREAAMALKCALWLCVPPRFELSVADYEARLEDLLLSAHDPNYRRAPILEYGNELWNAAFPVHGWLQNLDGTLMGVSTWHEAAAHEIAILKRVADRVFGPPGALGQRPYHLFVGGQLPVPSHLHRILDALKALGIMPDLAGPALYVTPLKASVEEWEATGAVPSQDELRSSCLARLEQIENGTPKLQSLKRQVEDVKQLGVPYFACYEAGQSLIAGAHPWRRAAIEAQGTEWMGELYRGIRRVAEGAGVDLLNWYSAATDQTPSDPRVDVFGLLDSTDLTKAPPKARAARGE
jgi:hypothetical protein